VKKSFGVIGASAWCCNCDWKTEAYKNAQANAARHARAYKHKVECEITNAGVYDATEEAPDGQ